MQIFSDDVWVGNLVALFFFNTTTFLPDFSYWTTSVARDVLQIKPYYLILDCVNKVVSFTIRAAHAVCGKFLAAELVRRKRQNCAIRAATVMERSNWHIIKTAHAVNEHPEKNSLRPLRPPRETKKTRPKTALARKISQTKLGRNISRLRSTLWEQYGGKNQS